jgi:hypothetical protein
MEFEARSVKQTERSGWLRGVSLRGSEDPDDLEALLPSLIIKIPTVRRLVSAVSATCSLVAGCVTCSAILATSLVYA